MDKENGAELKEHLCQLGRNRATDGWTSERVDKTGGPSRRDSSLVLPWASALALRDFNSSLLDATPQFLFATMRERAIWSSFMLHEKLPATSWR